MRKLVLALVMAAALSASARAEDIWFMNGVYKLDVPGGWRYEESDDFTGVALYPKDQTMHITVSAPNLDVEENDFRKFAGLQMGVVFRAIGSGKILNELTDDINGYPASCFVFSVASENGVELSGIGFVVYYDGASVSFIGVCRPSELERFVEIVGGIVDSHETNFEAVGENIDLVRTTSRRMLEEIEEEFGEWR